MSTASNQKPATANAFVEQELHKGLREVEAAFSCHALSLTGPLLQGVDDILRKIVEKRCVRDTASDKLVILLTTPGGFLEPVQRMVSTIRRHYRVVDFVIPNYAYSAGTIFALSGDAIHMDYYSRLGPIDPQIKSTRGRTASSRRTVSALGHLEKYNELIGKAQKGKISAAEVQLLIDGFDQAELYNIEQARDLSIAALEEWLVDYKFKNWTTTATRQIPVTLEMKRKRASQIGKQLNNTKRWHSHGYGISMDVLQNELKLLIDDFGKNPALSAPIGSYHDLLSDYMAKRDTEGVVHICDEYRPYM